MTPIDDYQAYLQYRYARFARLRQAAAENAAFNQLTQEEAMALVEEIRQERYEQQNTKE